MMLAKSLQSAAGNAAGEANYIEDVFSTWLYTGNGSTQTITNGIDLAGEGGLVWLKMRSSVNGHGLYDTARGAGKILITNSTDAEYSPYSGVSSFDSAGFSLGTDFGNQASQTYASWTFRKQPKFFDVVTWTGDGTGNGRRLAHNLGSVPGCMIFKRTNLTSNWGVWHRTFSNPTDDYLNLNLTNAVASFSNNWGTSAPTATDFPVGSSNTAGQEFVAYLFAHNAGGFGLSGEDNVISCGSYTGTSGASSPVVNLGYEPQWILIKRASGGTGEWLLFDNLRGMPVGGIDRTLRAETSGAEEGAADFLSPTATGFIVDPTLNQFINESGDYIYIAIRRGPMKVPESGTSVFKPAIRTGTGTTATVTGVGFPLDVVITNTRNYPGFAGHVGQFWDRLRGAGRFLRTPFTDAEGTVANAGVLGQDGYTVSNSSGGQNGNGEPFVDYSFRRAPSVFDVVCYTGTGSATTVSHNLTVAPELWIVKKRSDASGDGWPVGCKLFSSPTTKYFLLNSTGVGGDYTFWNNTLPTASVFSLGVGNDANQSGQTYVAYLFASAPGVSKVGSYTGTAATLQINCGFTTGARFVLIKRTDDSGDWVLWDSSRGMVAGTDPRLALNSTAAEVNANWVYATSGGFEIVTSDATVNASGGSYIFLSIA